MTEVLLTSEAFVRNTTNVSDNLAGKFLQSSIREAQEVGLRHILGDALTDSIKAKVADRSIDAEENAAYKDLLERAQYFIAYSAIVEVVMKVSYKIDNFGLSRTTDENQSFASFDEVAKQRYYYQAKADGCANALQRWILDHRTAFPELTEAACNQLRANLVSSASCGIWLGGPRGFMRKGGRRK